MIDRDIRPIFVNDPSFGGIIDRYPLVNKDWTGDNIGGERRSIAAEPLALGP